MQFAQKYLNPLYRSLDNISDFSDFIAKNQLETEEFPYFENLEKLTLTQASLLMQRLNALENELEEQISIIENETGDDKKEAVGVYNQLLKKIHLMVDRVNRQLEIIDNPYFGKVVIDRSANSKLPAGITTAYLGKFAYFDEESKKVLVTDWRAPIANVYYTNSGPKADIKFTTPVGEINGDLTQKRQFETSSGRIHHIYDAKSGNVSADEFLLAQLNRRLGKKLTEIVATIQQQQNDIIRADIDKTLILQGVAGSGKTTIVLHRLAYVFYTYPEKIHPEKTLIMAPNRMFLDYISDVLPSLGIQNVEANTYLFWAKKILKWSDRIRISNKPEDLKIKQEKGSLKFIKQLEDFFEEYENNVLENLPYSESDKVVKRYFELKNNHNDIFFVERLNLALESAFLNKDVISAYKNSTVGVSQTTKDRVSTYVNQVTDIKKIYLEYISRYYSNSDIEKYTKETLTRDTFCTEDLAPLVWLYFKLFGISEYQKEYIVVDEAQDMSLFELYTLYLISKKGNLFLAGDLAQSIIPPFYIQSWGEVTNMIKIFNGGANIDYFQLNRCYRATVEVIEYGNNIFRKYFPTDYHLPEAVLRHGDSVVEKKISDIKELIPTINDQFEKNSATVALITKDEIQAQEVYEELKKYEDKLTNPIFTYSDSDYKTGILVLPVNKAKGLEFDSVLLLDKNRYNFDIELDVRLYYVAITRALHRLFIIS